MDRSYLDRLTTANSERVLKALTQQQHLHPTRSVARTLQTVCREQGYPDMIAEQVLHELSMNGQTRTGRLVRQQIRALAVTLESTWQEALAQRIRAHEPEHV